MRSSPCCGFRQNYTAFTHLHTQFYVILLCSNHMYIHFFKFRRIFLQIDGRRRGSSANGRYFFGIFFRYTGAPFPVKLSDQRIFTRNWREFSSVKQCPPNFSSILTLYFTGFFRYIFKIICPDFFGILMDWNFLVYSLGYFTGFFQYIHWVISPDFFGVINKTIPSFLHTVMRIHIIKIRIRVSGSASNIAV